MPAPCRAFKQGCRLVGALGCLLLGGGLLIATPASSATEGASAPSERVASYQVKGFRSARFGDDEAAVRRAIRKDFGLTDSAMSSEENPIERTRILSVELKELPPGPGPVRVVYVFGFKSQRLVQVNVVWAVPNGSAEEGKKLLASAATLSAYLRTFKWDGGSREGVPLDETRVGLFIGKDAKGAGVSLVASARLVKVRPDGSLEPPPPESAAAPVPSLTIHYVADLEHPDIYRVREGEF